MLLSGKAIQLELLSENHRNDLYHAAQDERIWNYTPTPGFGEEFQRWFESALNKTATQEHLAFAVRRLTDQKIIGSTRYYDLSLDNRRLAIGYTWYIPAMWGTTVNPECKYLLLQHAFETLQLNRIEFIVDARNVRSRAAIKKLGAQEEGLLRQHIILENGFVRDSIMFSIIQSEWPMVKSALKTRLRIAPI